MGAHTTIRVTRSVALKLYMERHFPKISDQQLEDFLDAELDKSLYNVLIVDDDYQYTYSQMNGNEIAESIVNRNEHRI